jgi:hypothetical protein
MAARCRKMPDALDDDHGRGQLRAHAELVAEEHHQRGHHHVGHERDDEHLGVEDPVEPGAEAAEDGVEGGDHGDRQVGLQPQRHGGVEQQPSRMPAARPRIGITVSPPARARGPGAGGAADTGTAERSSGRLRREGTARPPGRTRSAVRRCRR